ncbi:MAG: protein GvpF 2 [Luteitalea sp.]|nr:protein GvpF 2 [Luteitalea sp.]
MPKPTANPRRSRSAAAAPPSSKRTSRSPGPAARGVKSGAAMRRSTPARTNGKAAFAGPPRVAVAEPRPEQGLIPAATAATAATAETDGAVAVSRGKYVYCIIEAADPLKFGPIGIGAHPSPVYSVHYRNLAAVVSEAPLEVLDSTRENVLAHERVNETVMREHTVIPMSFGTIFKTREDIVELLRSAAEAFGDVLNKMQNKLEFGLKVLWDRDQAIRQIESEDDDISRLKEEISGQKGSTYFARMQYGRLVDAALQARSERYVVEILEQLRDVSVASRINKPIGDKMIMNAAFLISRDREVAFDGKVKSIASRFDRLTFKYTGPWPPYNFVNIRLKLERA